MKQAAISAFDPEHYTLLPQTTIEDVFASVQSGQADYGVVPFENSTNGSVVFTLDLFADQQKKHPDIVVCGERYVDVHHCLLGRPAAAAAAAAVATTTSQDLATKDSQANGHVSSDKTASTQPRALQPATKSPSSSGHATPIPSNPSPASSRTAPLTSLAHIKKLYSHPQAWGQCKTFLSCYLKGIERQDVSSTSRAAEMVAADETGTSAAISSGIAAQMHGLKFLARDIEDERNNATRFFVLRKRVSGEEKDKVEGEGEGEGVIHGNGHVGAADGAPRPVLDFKSLLSFTVSHADAGALADALAVFKRHGLNLTSINSRPSGQAPWHYIFFVELQGKLGQAAVNEALVELTDVVKVWRWLGSWKNQLTKR